MLSRTILRSASVRSAVLRSPITAASSSAASSSSSSSLISSSSAPISSSQSRSFGAHHVPVGPGSNINGVYRRPNAPVPTAPLSEHDELIWDDAQAPEPTFDEFEETNRWEALGKLVGALLFVFVGVHGAVRLYGPENRQVTVPQEYPFNNLRLSHGSVPEAKKE